MAGTYPFSDDFNDNSHDTAKWSKAAYANTDANVTVLEQNQRLEIGLRASFAGSAYNGYKSVETFDFTNRCVEVEVVQAAGAGAGAVITDLLIGLSADDLAGFSMEGTVLYFVTRSGGTPEYTTLTYSATTHRWWRIRHARQDDTLRWETSEDGIVWTQRRSLARPWAITDVWFNILAGTYASVASPGTAIFDNFSAYVADLYPRLDEESADDDDYIVNTSTTAARVQLSSISPPQAGDVILRVRARTD